MSNSQSNTPASSNETPNTPRPPGVVASPPQQNQGDKPAAKPGEQQK